MTIKRITVAQHERALVWKNKTFAGVLEPGKHWLIAPMSDVQAQLHDLTVPEFEHARVDFLVKEASATMQKYFDIVELTDSEAGLVYKNGKLAGVLAPGKRQLYWKGPIEVKVEKIDLAADPEVAAPSGQAARACEAAAAGAGYRRRELGRSARHLGRIADRGRQVREAARAGSARVLEVPAHGQGRASSIAVCRPWKSRVRTS